jgi:hypothetical protein
MGDFVEDLIVRMKAAKSKRPVDKTRAHVAGLTFDDALASAERQQFLDDVAADGRKEFLADVATPPAQDNQVVADEPVYNYEYTGPPTPEHLKASQEALRFACRDLGIQRHPKVRWCRLFGKVGGQWIPAKGAGTKTGFTFGCQFDGMARRDDWTILINSETSPERVRQVVLHELKHLQQYQEKAAISETDCHQYEVDALARMQTWERGDLTAFVKAAR